MESNIQINLNILYVILFVVLGVFSCFMHIPKEQTFSGYRKSRLILGSAFFFMAAYCVLRFFKPQDLDVYVDFWVLSIVSLLFSWLNYTSFLYIIDTRYSIRKNFIIDGIIPLAIMLVTCPIGLILSEHKVVFEVVLGSVFIAKNIRMFYICEREWHKVNREQQNFYDEEVDILWMRVLVWLTFILSVCTLIALFVPAIHFFYCYVAPMVFVYMTFKVVNYLPRKIDRMRYQIEEGANNGVKQPNAPKITNLEDKIKPLVERWVAQGHFCQPNLSIKGVAVQMGTNHNYLSQYLNNTLNTTFQVWLNTLRIEESKRILATENISIEEVGVRVGIPESYNFSRWFKQVTGTTPFKYRKGGNQQ